MLPARDGVLAVRLTAPGGNSESVSARLFDIVADAVTPAADHPTALHLWSAALLRARARQDS